MDPDVTIPAPLAVAEVPIPAPFTVDTIAAALGEQDEAPLAQIKRILLVFGRVKTWRLLQKTVETEANGGLLIRNGSRRRTPGGTFFRLARSWCTSLGEQQRIFGNVQRRDGSIGVLVPPTTPKAKAPMVIPTLAEALGQLPPLHGEDCRMKTTLIGRPDQIVKRDGYVVFKLTGALAPSLPKGLPKAPATPLSWVVMVAQKQWSKAAESLSRDPQARAIIEGYPCMEGTALVLLATMATTTELQKAKSQAKAEVVS
jgi:hypothetical protein